MKKFTKFLIIVASLSLVAFIVSLFIYPDYSLFSRGQRDTIATVCFYLFSISLLVSLIMIFPKKWRKNIYIPCSILVSSAIIFIIFIGDGYHFTLSPERSAKRAIKRYMRHHKHELQDLGEIFYQKIDTAQGYCKAVGIAYNYNKDKVDTLTFSYNMHEYNNAIVYDSENVLTTSLTSQQLSWVIKNKVYYSDMDIKRIESNWPIYMYHLRQATAHFIANTYMTMKTEGRIYPDKTIHITVQLKNNVYPMKDPKLLFIFDNKVDEPDIRTWYVSADKNETITQEFVFNHKYVSSYTCLCMPTEVYNDVFLSAFLDEANDSFWDNWINGRWYYSRDMGIDTSCSFIIGYINNWVHTGIEKTEKIEHELDAIDRDCNYYFYTCFFEDSTYSRHNVYKRLIEKEPISKYYIYNYYSKK